MDRQVRFIAKKFDSDKALESYKRYQAGKISVGTAIANILPIIYVYIIANKILGKPYAEDLFSASSEKILMLLLEGNFDSTRSSGEFKRYLYVTVKNTLIEMIKYEYYMDECDLCMTLCRNPLMSIPVTHRNVEIVEIISKAPDEIRLDVIDRIRFRGKKLDYCLNLLNNYLLGEGVVYPNFEQRFVNGGVELEEEKFLRNYMRILIRSAMYDYREREKSVLPDNDFNRDLWDLLMAETPMGEERFN